MRTLGKTIKWSTAIGLSLLALTGCQDPQTFVPTNSDEFTYYDKDSYGQANQVLQADYLFVTDYSESMYNQVENLVSGLDTFADDLSSSNIDYKIGFVRGTTSTAGDTLTYIPSTLVASPIISGASDIQSLIQAQLDVQGIGTSLAPNGRYMLEAARRVAKNSSLGFLRDAAQLVYIFVSDNDDVSVKDSGLASHTLSNYISSLKSVKSDSSYINARAWVLGESAGCNASTDVSSGEGAGANLAAAAQSLNTGTSTAIQCLGNSSDMAASLQDLARNVTRPTARFKLRVAPISAAGISVSVDGTAQVVGTDWNYAASTQEVVFVTGHEPSPGSSLEIDYSPLFTLSGSADVSTIVVTANGVTVPQSDTNGWSYVAATQQLVLNGLSEGADVRVTYQAN